jgi:hypothetical protein
MQSEQQVNTIQTQPKKSTGPKKEKKSNSKNTNTDKQSVDEVVEKLSVEPLIEQLVVELKPSVQEPSVQEHSEQEHSEQEPISIEQNKSHDEVFIQEIEFSSVLDFINSSSDKLTEFSKYFKDNALSKDERGKIEISFKKFQKSYNIVQTSYYDHLSRQVSILEKSSGNKSNGHKKIQDKEKSAIHKKLPVHSFLLNFMKIDEGTLVSRSEALTAITGFVKKEKEINPDIIVENDKRSFKLIGELKILFNGIEQVMRSKNLLNKSVSDEDMSSETNYVKMPTEIKYTQIMQYMTHCFIKSDETTIV